MPKLVRERIVFAGAVQGVGFRYTCAHLANDLGISGWVRNEYDGTVVGEFQGTVDQIESLISQLGSARFIKIAKIDREPRPLSTTETGFQITH